MAERVALITGGCGFVASFVAKHILDTTSWNVVLLGKSESKHAQLRLKDIGAVNNSRVQFIRADISETVPFIKADYVLHLGAESHVTTSIAEPEKFIRSNVVGTMRMLEWARLIRPEKFLYFSTDEVYGPAANGEIFTEWSRYNSTNPYAATKAAAEELCLAWQNTYGVPVVITHCMNVIGERQHPEKFVPMVVRKVLDERLIDIHTDGKGNAATRGFVHGGDVARAVLTVLEKGEIRQKYNIPAAVEVKVDDLALKIGKIIGKTPTFVYRAQPVDRPGHDMRYSVGGDNLSKLGFEPQGITLRPIVQWYLDHAEEWY